MMKIDSSWQDKYHFSDWSVLIVIILSFTAGFMIGSGMSA